MAKKITELTELTTYATNDLLVIEDVSTSTTKKITWANLVASDSITFAKVAAGFSVQTVATNYSAAATGNTIIPNDDTIPQITEGFEVMTQAITPKATSNRLVIDANVFIGNANATQYLTVALFQDATANALATVTSFLVNAGSILTIPIKHEMAAGTVSSTTFRIRIGSNQTTTSTFNGTGGARLYGAITKSSIVITEYKA